MVNNQPLLVHDLGEHGLLAILQRYCPLNIIGDDGAILMTDSLKSLVVTTDVLVDEVHFSDRTTSAYDVGWRAVAANLSDLAAMGAAPLGITVGLSLPGDTQVSWVEELYQGMEACLNLYPIYPTPIVGGDLCRSRIISLAITAFGQVSPSKAILRSAARPGDAIIVTGLHGLSRGGLELLLNRHSSDCLQPDDYQGLISAHQRPIPRLDILKYLAQVPEKIAIAGMDSSDGLADAIRQICQSSKVGATIMGSKLEVDSRLIKLTGLQQAREWVLYGGEDFELVLCLPPHLAAILVSKLDAGAAIIGTITREPEIKIVNFNDADDSIILNINKEFQHF